MLSEQPNAAPGHATDRNVSDDSVLALCKTVFTQVNRRSPNFVQRSSIVYAPTRAVTKAPTHLTLRRHQVSMLDCMREILADLVTQPME